MHQIEIEVINSACFKLAHEKGPDILFLFEVRGGKLVCQEIAFARVTACKALLKGKFGLAPDIAVRCIKIIKPFGNELIDHLLCLLNIHFFAEHGQAHASKPEITVYFIEKTVIKHNRSSAVYYFYYTTFSHSLQPTFFIQSTANCRCYNDV